MNHSCVPNCRCESTRGKEGICYLKALRDIAVGEEITVIYGSKYFGERYENCKCPKKWEHRKVRVDQVSVLTSRSTRLGKSFGMVADENASTVLVSEVDVPNTSNE